MGNDFKNTMEAIGTAMLPVLTPLANGLRGIVQAIGSFANDNPRLTATIGMLAGALAGLGGVMFAAVQGTFDPNLGFQVLFLIFTTVVLGGIGSPYGALAAGTVLGLAMELSTWQGLGGGLEARYKPVLAFTVLILLLLCRPQGLFGKARVL